MNQLNILIDFFTGLLALLGALALLTLAALGLYHHGMAAAPSVLVLAFGALVLCFIYTTALRSLDSRLRETNTEPNNNDANE